MEKWAGVVMAAGLGTRMRSKVPKILHKVCGQALVLYPVQALQAAGVTRIGVVVSPQTEESVRELLGESVEYVLQAEPLGTGHALLQAAHFLEGQTEHTMVLSSDEPLVLPTTLEKLSDQHLSTDSTFTLLTATSGPQEGRGKVIREASGSVVDVVEAAELDAGEGNAEYEANSSVYCFQTPWLLANLPRIERSQSEEFYVTSLVGMASSQGVRVETLKLEDPIEILGINDRSQLARIEAALRHRIRAHWMLEGVTMTDPATTYVDASVELGQDTVILPNTMVLGSSRIGRDCTIGPNTVIRDSIIGDGCEVVASFLEEATVEGSVDIGPFSHLRFGTYLESGVHIGNYAEIKNSRLGHGVNMGHLGYLGDATIGANVNLGAGMITCNYDGVTKHRTEVEEGAFIGCDTMFVAPVKVGQGAVTGAGAVVTKDVPPYRLAVGVPAKIKDSKKTRH